MSRGPDCGTRLVRAILRDAERAGCPVTLASADWTRWSSATFGGARHDLALAAAPSEALDRWIAALPDAELSAPAMLVADLTIVGIRRTEDAVAILIEALTVET